MCVFYEKIMEIGENVEKSENVLHLVQSQPSIIIHDENSPKATNNKDRRVSFASNQLARYLEPINPFESLSKFSKYIDTL